MPVGEHHRPVSRLVHQAEVGIALGHRDRIRPLAPVGEHFDEAVPHGNPVVGGEQLGRMPLGRRGHGGRLLRQQVQVPVVAGPGPQVVVMVAGDEPEGRADGSTRPTGAECGDELGEGGCSVFGRGEGQLEQVTEHHEVGRILTALTQRAEALAEGREHGRRSRTVDVLAVRRDVREQAVECSEMQVGDAYPSDWGHEESFPAPTVVHHLAADQRPARPARLADRRSGWQSVGGHGDRHRATGRARAVRAATGGWVWMSSRQWSSSSRDRTSRGC